MTFDIVRAITERSGDGLDVRPRFLAGQIVMIMNAYRDLERLEAMISSGNINLVDAKSLIESVRAELHNINSSQQQLIESNQALIKLNREFENRAQG